MQCERDVSRCTVRVKCRQIRVFKCTVSAVSSSWDGGGCEPISWEMRKNSSQRKVQYDTCPME
eukprot:946704-Amorphochlora_amoeboformis.AAC.2